ncbi:MAG: 23S rRNA (guanosine(2251)-2'-O)-methyltransferase RlmB [Nitratiruptor sp.]|nr:23S rRNA (guanosine(2251)-2'-O)-methyltransferase RlmB [Nitratiruptor sp.]NPA83025.1 23S rRNA (guanosine(2251)-2'-O)-methyltransferase RlmB [Campylobacterota bacterium]
MYVYGKQIFFYLLERHPERIRGVFVTKPLDRKVVARLKELGIEPIVIDNRRAQALARGGNHQGYIVLIDPPPLTDLESLKAGRFLVVLYGVTDVGNIGSIIRSAYALGADGVVLTNVRSIKLEGVIRTSSGAALDMPPALVPNALDLIKELHDVGFTVYGAHMEGVDVRQIQFRGKRAIVLGSEGEGIAPKVLDRCDGTLRIAMRREFDSLNVSAAGAIFIDRMRDE